MNVVNLADLRKSVELISSDEMAMYLNLFYHDLVGELLEFITIFSDDELIQEICNLLKLDATCVVDQTIHGSVVVGYINGGVVHG